MHGLCTQLHRHKPGASTSCRPSWGGRTASHNAYISVCNRPHGCHHRATASAMGTAGAAAAAVAVASGRVQSPDGSTPPSAATLLDPEVKARHRRPEGWVAPGPRPAGPQGHRDLAPAPDETLSYLTGDWRIFQLRNGHRWSLDDMVTALVALQQATSADAISRPITHHLDLGCGIGSVLLMVAWGLPGVASCGVEAQGISLALARRSILYNGAGDRVQVLQGDLRTAVLPHQQYDLITGTPPYIPLGAGAMSARPQKGPCCLETRGGIEEYCSAAARHLAPGGTFVVCAGVQGQPHPNRGLAAAAAAGLQVVRLVEVLPKEGKPPLMHVYVCKQSPPQQNNPQQQENTSAQECHRGGDQQQQQQQQHVPSVCLDVGGLQARPWSINSSSSSSSSSSGGGTDHDGVLVKEVFTVRAADGSLTQQMHAARAFMGLPP